MRERLDKGMVAKAMQVLNVITFVLFQLPAQIVFSPVVCYIGGSELWCNYFYDLWLSENRSLRANFVLSTPILGGLWVVWRLTLKLRFVRSEPQQSVKAIVQRSDAVETFAAYINERVIEANKLVRLFHTMSPSERRRWRRTYDHYARQAQDVTETIKAQTRALEADTKIGEALLEREEARYRSKR